MVNLHVRCQVAFWEDFLCLEAAGADQVLGIQFCLLIFILNSKFISDLT